MVLVEMMFKSMESMAQEGAPSLTSGVICTDPFTWMTCFEKP